MCCHAMQAHRLLGIALTRLAAQTRLVHLCLPIVRVMDCGGRDQAALPAANDPGGGPCVAARELATQLLGIAAAHLDMAGAEALLGELCGVAASAPRAKTGAGAASGTGSAGAAQPPRGKARFEEVDGALAAVGYLLAQCAVGAL